MTFYLGVLFVIGGIIELYVDSVKLKKGGSLLFFIIKNAFSSRYVDSRYFTYYDINRIFAAVKLSFCNTFT